MDSSLHAFIAAQHIQDRMEQATAIRTAREARRRDRRRAWPAEKEQREPGHDIGAPAAYAVHAQTVER